MERILDIWAAAKETPKATKARFSVMLLRDLTDEESLLRTFGDGSTTEDDEDGKAGEESAEDEESAAIDLDLKKSFYYVINPDCEVTDCAEIYSFLHEENVFKRIIARVCKDADIRINKP